MATQWEYWDIRDAATGAQAWLGVSRPGAGARIDRLKLWTLITAPPVFLANWQVTADYHRSGGAHRWTYTHIDVAEARRLALTAPGLTADERARLTRPEQMLTLEQIDRRPVATILGKRSAEALSARPAGR